MDFQSMTLTALFAVGSVNIVLLFKPELESKWKIVISFVAAFLAFFIPADLGTLLANAIKEAILAAGIGSGVYKLMTKSGGN